MLIRSLIWSLTVFLVTAVSTARLQADLVRYSDRSDFNAVTSGLNYRGFNDAFGGTFTLRNYGGVTVRIQSHQQPFSSGTNPRVVSEGPRALQYTSRDLDTKVTFTFAVPINAFGIDIKDWGTVGTGRLLVENDTGTLSEVVASVDPSSHLPIGNMIFFGVIDDTPFETVSIYSNTRGDLIGLDFLVFGQASNIPEPSSLITLWVAVGWLAQRRRR